MANLIKVNTYETLTGIKLPIVNDPMSLSLDREINLFRTLVATGLSKADDRAVARALEMIGAMLSKQGRLTRTPLMAKANLTEFATRLAAIAADVTGLKTVELERRLIDAASKETNADDFE